MYEDDLDNNCNVKKKLFLKNTYILETNLF